MQDSIAAKAYENLTVLRNRVRVVNRCMVGSCGSHGCKMDTCEVFEEGTGTFRQNIN